MKSFTIAPRRRRVSPFLSKWRIVSWRAKTRSVCIDNHRRMTQNELAAANIHAVYLSQIETGKRTGSTKTLAAIAKALNVAVDDLI